jgi:hypothetical protein
MEAQDFYTTIKKKSTIENEYFIAMDKQSFFGMMDAYATYKIEQLDLAFYKQLMESSEMLDKNIFAK